MRIAIDARELGGRPTGVGRYLSELLAAWEQMPEARAHEFILLRPADGDGSTAWEQLELPRLVREARADLLFAPGYTGPLRCAVPMVVAVHDVSFAAHPEWFSWREGARRRTITRLAAERAARVLTISEFSRREIVRHLGVPESKVTVTYLGVTSSLAARAFTARQAHTILYVGSLFNRRHIAELVAGVARLAQRQPGVRLELVGDNRTRPHLDVGALALAAGARDAIGVQSYVPDEELAALYAGARAFVFLSSYEGFGLTPLEALASGLPIVVLDTAVAREIYGDAAIYVTRPDPALIDAALERALFDEPERARVMQAAPAILARYSWPRCAERVLDVLIACRA